MITITDTEAPDAALDRVRVAAAHLYDAECALHIAHQTHVDEWITAASNRLHEATADHLAARAEYLAARTAARTGTQPCSSRSQDLRFQGALA